MRPNLKIRMGIDGLMSVLLVVLMAFQVTGEYAHAWIGVVECILFITHHILNLRWYKTLLKGRYPPVRILGTAINFGLLVCMISLGVSGVAMVHDGWAGAIGGMTLMRQLHLCTSYWGFVLMDFHIGLHWNRIWGTVQKTFKQKPNPVLLRMGYGLLALVAGYGVYCFWRLNLFSYMILANTFVFFDFSQSAVSVLAQYLAMMVFWVWAGSFIGFLLRSSKPKPSCLQRK